MIKTYRAGTWLCVSAPGATVLTAPGVSQTALAKLFAAVQAGASVADVVQVLLEDSGGTSLASLPPFAAALSSDDGVRVAVRGPVSVEGKSGDAVTTVSGNDVTTWREERLTEPTVVALSVDGQGEPGRELELVSGVVLAGQCTVDLLGERPALEAAAAATPPTPDWAAGWEGDAKERITFTGPIAPIEEEIATPAAADAAPAPQDAGDAADAADAALPPEAEEDAAAGAGTEDAEDAEAQAKLAVADATPTPPEGEDVVPLAEADTEHVDQPGPEGGEAAAEEPSQDPSMTSTQAWMGAPEDIEAASVPPPPLAGSADAAGPIEASFDFLQNTPAPPVAENATDPDHDGQTIASASPVVEGAPQPTGADAIPDQIRVLGRTCPNCGTANPPTFTNCRACQAPLSGDAVTMPRPSLGQAWISTGELIELDRPAVIGRRPRSTKFGPGQVPQLITVPSPNQDISRSHLEIDLEDWSVLVKDMGTTNGTILKRPGQPDRRLHPGEQVLAQNGDTFDIGDGVLVTVGSLI
ncbi:MAG: FHA domain-containing protein [Bifidobacteriaceae bacterium]|jgi:hypothetical protein|nr:FHA domain-containing protein [Bifidobacteriaceae bacterium]